MTSAHPARAPRRRAFTLIEVLIAVLVLALGLLGLGAVFPVVVRAQRLSSEDIQGTNAASSARAFLAGYDFRSAMVPWNVANQPDNRSFWLDLRNDPVNGLNLPSSGPNSPSAPDSGYWLSPAVDNITNATLVGAPANNAQGRPLSSQVLIPVRERLFPQGAAGNPAPQFVWDIAVHRVPDFNGATDATRDDLEVAVFVRRLDPRIKTPAGMSVYQVLTGEAGAGVPNGDRRRPVGVFTSGVDAELPTGDGTGDYARPITADVEYRYNPPGQAARDRLYMLPAVSEPAWRMVRQTGQKLVDNLGQVHTVRSWVADGSDRYVVLESPVRVDPGSSVLVQQVVFTPQVPASVFIHRIKP
jgi:prepilin-type N-terminal cleavage/methylation domain-containing protein